MTQNRNTIQRIIATSKAAAAKASGIASDFVADVEALRSQLRDLDIQRSQVAASPIAANEVAARIDDYLSGEELRARDWLNFAALSAPARSKPAEFSIAGAFTHHPVGVLVLLGQRDQIRGALLAEAKDASPGNSMTFAERETELSQIYEAAQSTAIAIEVLIRQAEAAGVKILRDASADPEHLLAKQLI